MTTDRLLTKKEVAKYLAVCPTTVERLVHRKGILPAYRVGADLRFRLEDVEQYLDSARVQSRNSSERPCSVVKTKDVT